MNDLYCEYEEKVRNTISKGLKVRKRVAFLDTVMAFLIFLGHQIWWEVLIVIMVENTI